MNEQKPTELRPQTIPQASTDISLESFIDLKVTETARRNTMRLASIVTAGMVMFTFFLYFFFSTQVESLTRRAVDYELSYISDRLESKYGSLRDDIASIANDALNAKDISEQIRRIDIISTTEIRNLEARIEQLEKQIEAMASSGAEHSASNGDNP